MRPLRKLNANPTTLVAARRTFRYSSSSSDGGDGRGRGRGLLPPSSPPLDPSSSRAPGKPPEPLFPAARGGRGGGLPLETSHPPPFPSFFSSPPLGRGRGAVPSPSPEPDPSLPKKPIFLRLPVDHSTSTPGEDAGERGSRPVEISFSLPGAGRGKEKLEGLPTKPAPSVGNRHARQAPSRGGGRGTAIGIGRGRGEMYASARGRGTAIGGDGIGRGRGEMYASARGSGGARGRGGRMGRLRPREETEAKGLYLGNDADGEKLTKRLGVEGAEELKGAMEEASRRALPCPHDDAYRRAVHWNNLLEFEPEYLMEEFGTNPDIDEKPPLPLDEELRKMKPFFMEFEGIETEEEWKEAFDDVMKRSSFLKAVVDKYSGPDRITAKQQHEELEKIATTFPQNIPSVKRFTERALLSLQSNPGWGFDKKCKFMNKLAYQMSQHYK